MSEFRFVAVRGPKKSTDPATRKIVREHVAKQRRKRVTCPEDLALPQALPKGGSKFSWRLEKNHRVPSTSSRILAPARVLSSPVSMLGAARADPFNVFPIRIRKGDLELVDFWMTDLAFQRYGPSLGESYVPMRDLFFAQAVEHESSAHGMLFLSASWISSSRPSTAAQNQVAALYHRGKVFEKINDALARSDFTMPGLIQTIGFQLVYEAVAGNYHECRRHLVGMRSVLLAIGGLHMVSKEPRVQMVFIYLSIATTPDYLPIFPPDAREVSSVTDTHNAHRDLTEINLFVDELLSFLRRVQALSERGWCLRGTESDNNANPFRPRTALHQMLDPGWQPWSADFDGYLGATRTTRAACLLLLCHSFIALDAPSQACDNYVAQQISIVQTEKADIKPNLRAFIHLLLKDPRGVRLRDLDVAYNASRNAQVIKRLSRPLHDKVARMLLGCLSGEQGPNHTLSPEDFQEIRDEALNFQPPPQP